MPGTPPATTQQGGEVIDHHQVIEAEPSEDSGISDLDSIYSGDTGSITDTLASYAAKFVEFRGREYDHKGSHPVAIDSTQQDQMDLFHDIYFRLMGNKLYRAPIGDKPHRVLDVGTGTGIWAIHFGDDHPTAEVIGNDLSPIQPNWVPPNVKFEIDDANENWTYTKESFDFIHIRALHGAITNWQHLHEQAFKCLKPGGWLEVVGEDIKVMSDDNTLPKGSPIKKWTTACKTSLRKMDREPMPYRADKTDSPYKTYQEGWFTNAGFDMSSFKHEVFKIAVGTWPKKKEEKTLGGLMLINMLQGLHGWSVFLFMKILGQSEDEFKKFMKDAEQDLKNKKQHKYMRVNVFYAQKPLKAEPASGHTVS